MQKDAKNETVVLGFFASTNTASAALTLLSKMSLNHLMTGHPLIILISFALVPFIHPAFKLFFFACDARKL